MNKSTSKIFGTIVFLLFLTSLIMFKPVWASVLKGGTMHGVAMSAKLCKLTTILNTTGGDYWRLSGNPSVVNSFRQRFQVSGDTINVCQVTAKMFRSFLTSGHVHAEIWTADGTDTPSGGASVTNGISNSLDAMDFVETVALNSGTNQTFTFSSPPTLTAGDYWLIITDDGDLAPSDGNTNPVCNSGTIGCVRWETSTDANSYNTTTYDGWHSDIGDLGEDFVFAIYTN